MAKAKKTAPKKASTGKKRGRPPGPAKAKPEAKQRRERMSANQINKEDRALFLQHLPLIAKGKAAYEHAHSNYRKLLKTAKADGFLKDDFDFAFRLQLEGGEKKITAKIARELTIAKYLGVKKLGDNLDLFLDQEVEEQPPEQRAFDAGKQDALENKKADPTGFEEQAYLKGFHSVSEQRLKGMKQAEPAKETKPTSPAVKAAADRAAAAAERKKAQTQEKSPEQEKAAQQRAQDAEEFDAPSSGVPMTRSQFNAAQQQGKEPEQGNNTGGGMFQRKEAASNVH